MQLWMLLLSVLFGALGFVAIRQRQGTLGGILIAFGVLVFIGSFISQTEKAITEEVVLEESEIVEETKAEIRQPSGGSSLGQPEEGSQPTQERPLPEKPKVDFSGWVEPPVASTGEKVIIHFDVENLSEDQSLNGMRILFANSRFLTEGLVIVNVMSGGVQDGRAFEWSMEIPAKEKRSYQIVAYANEVGNYESVITLQSDGHWLEDPEGNSELLAKLTVVP